MSRKLPNEFGKIPKKIWERLEGKNKQFLFKYNYHMEKIDKLNEKIESQMETIKNLRNERKRSEKRVTELWNENKHLNENYNLSYNISTNKKYTSIKKRKGFNKEGKSKTELLNNRKLIGKYWLINFKYKGKSKSIHIGEDKSVKKFIKENEYLKDNFKIPKTLSEDKIRSFISHLIEDNLYELVYKDIMGKHNLFEIKITFNELLK